MRIRRGDVVEVDTEDGSNPRPRRVAEIRITPEGFEFICTAVGKPSERRWGKTKRPEYHRLHEYLLVRVRLRVSRYDLARDINCEEDELMCWEKGLAIPTGGQLERWEAALAERGRRASDRSN